MDKRIAIVKDYKRGCGWRKRGGLYLMGSEESMKCGRLPIPLKTCPCCGYGIRPSRQPTWIDGRQLLFASGTECPNADDFCAKCPLGNLENESELDRSLLIWIGERHYPTVRDFEREADRFGISRRIQAVPREFKIGETWVFLAHPKVIHSPPEFGEEVEWMPAIFHIFRPKRIEMLVTGEESKEEIDALMERGITPVVSERVPNAETEAMWEEE